MLLRTLLALVVSLTWGAWALGLEVPKGTAKVVFYDRAGRPLKALADEDGDGRFETVFYFEGGHLEKRLELTDKGLPVETLFYDPEGRPLRLELDRNRDGKPDQWQYYSSGRPMRLEEDRDFDGRVDLKAELNRDGDPIRILRDEDGDGCFEVEESPFPGGRELGLRRIEDQKTCKGRLYARVFYRGGKLSKRLLDLDGDGHFETEELFRDGQRCLVLKRGKGLEAFWYEGGEEPRFSFEDADGDGRFERRYDFSRKAWESLNPALTLETLKERCR